MMARPRLHRYPFASLASAMRMTEPQAARSLRLRDQRCIRNGVTQGTAELLAHRAGFHPYEVWPEMPAVILSEADAQAERAEANAARRREAKKRKYWADPVGARAAQRRRRR